MPEHDAPPEHDEPPERDEPRTLLEPRTAADRLACESLIGLSIGDALGAPYEGSGFNPIRLEPLPVR